MLGQGASSRAAGVVRMQGGTPEAVRLGLWSRRFYLRQRAEIGTDSGFTQQGYLLPCFTAGRRRGGPGADGDADRPRAAGALAQPGEVDEVNPTMAPGQTLGATYCAEDGYITPPRNVAAYTSALLRSGVEVAERTSRSAGWRPALPRRRRWIPARDGSTPGLVVLTGGPKLAAVGRLAGLRSRRAACGTRSR